MSCKQDLENLNFTTRKAINQPLLHTFAKLQSKAVFEKTEKSWEPSGGAQMHHDVVEKQREKITSPEF